MRWSFRRTGIYFLVITPLSRQFFLRNFARAESFGNSPQTMAATRELSRAKLPIAAN